MRKIVNSFLRVSSLSIFNSLKFKVNNVNAQKLLLAGGVAGYGFWFASTKIYSSDTLTFET